ncbi:AGE family epimerase/isomerase [Phenylobacterium sp.]|jgi:mannose-6-phosphate isomerase|uniref:AGE family epimerase/isomerase n=1 Tax=Phenylobacterium sp. TaxID=1871053 RepID=UPI002F3E3944
MTSEFDTLEGAARWYEAWLAEAALPLWADAGIDPAGGLFQEKLSVEGRAVEAPRRSRSQARQVFVYAEAARAGYGGRWLETARTGFARFLTAYQRPDGLVMNSAASDGTPLDREADNYQQAFLMLAQAALTAAGEPNLEAPAARALAALGDRRTAGGGFRENGPHPYQANCHMHLFESAQAWEAVGGPAWAALSDEIAGLAMDRLIEPRGAVLREFFDADWRALEGEGGLIEPGHQFEWAWLLERWGRARGRDDALQMARRLYVTGIRGVDPVREVAVNALWEDLTVRDGAARLWVQTEHLKAALALGRHDDALRAARGLAKYLDTPKRGAWRDRMLPDGSFVEEPSPATSFYHLMVAILELSAAAP